MSALRDRLRREDAEAALAVFEPRAIAAEAERDALKIQVAALKERLALLGDVGP